MMITYYQLRCIGFRFISNHTDPYPHMLACVHPNQEVGIEIAPYGNDKSKWCVWLRSDIAHSKCRFCYIRTVSTIAEVTQLMEAITGNLVTPEERDIVEFERALTEETADCERRRREFITDDRWGRIPGGL